MKRRAVLAMPWAICLPTHAREPSSRLPLSRSLRDELAAALRVSMPLLVMVSLDGCPFCKMVREQHLLPLLAEHSQPIVQVDMQSDMPVVDFDGKPRTHDQLVRSWDVRTAPTLLFLGASAKEVAPRLRGAPLADFYGAYLEDRLQVARREVGAQRR